MTTDDTDAKVQATKARRLIQGYIGPDHKVIYLGAFFAALVQALKKAAREPPPTTLAHDARVICSARWGASMRLVYMMPLLALTSCTTPASHPEIAVNKPPRDRPSLCHSRAHRARLARPV